MPECGKPIDFSKVATYTIKDRKSLVQVRDFASPHRRHDTFSRFLEQLPAILAGNDIRSVINAIASAHTNGRPVCLAMGAHVIKVGLAPVINDLIRRGVINMVAMNGAGIIHDLEVALAGQTSEDVGAALTDGSFGMARETGDQINQAIAMAGERKIGLGQAMGEQIIKQELPHKDLSILAAGRTHDIPVTVHVAMGTDIIHMHPGFDPAACGRASHIDFQTFTSIIADLDGGVFINAGSAVILPEVFLKGLTLARNLGFSPTDFTTVNLDFIRHYRPMTNVVNRPCGDTGAGFNLVGHHEIMIPLIAAGVIEKIAPA